MNRGGGVLPKADFGGAGGLRPHIAGWGGRLMQKRRPVFVRPQQKNGPTEVDKNNGVDPLPSKVCAGPFREKGTAKGEKCDCKTQRTVHL